jgi:hypothetical protein
MDFKENYKRLAAFFDRLNASEAPIESAPEESKLEFFWRNCMPEAIDPSSIIAGTQQKIHSRKKTTEKYRRTVKTIAVAASFLLVVSSTIYLLTSDSNDTTLDLRMIAGNVADVSTEEITLITSQNRLTIDENVLIQYTAEGNVDIESDIIKEPKNHATEIYDQLIVPKGKRSRIQLSDGTLLWVNSQSKIIYPRTFGEKNRNIYLQGEAYLEVARDKSRPFIVTANDFDLKVLGTKFNVTNYGNTGVANIVLVEGAVEVTDRHNSIAQLTPNDLLAIKNGTISQQTKVDTYDYTGWIDGILVLKGETLSVIAQKLSLYFGVDIRCEASIEKEKIYGKLDLKEDLSEILECIRHTVPINIQKHNNEIHLSKAK